MKKLLIVFTLLFAISWQPATAQGLLDKLADKADRKVKARADRKVDQGMDKGLDEVEGIFKKKQKKKDTEGASTSQKEQEAETTDMATEADARQDYADVNASDYTAMQAMSVEMKEVYSFNHEVKMEMKEYKNDKLKSTNDFSFLLRNEADMVGVVANMEQDGQPMQTKAIFNMKDMTMLSLMDQGGMKMGMKMKLDENMMEEGKVSSSDGSVSIKKTGRTKKILGYSAAEYESVHEDTYSLIWISDDVGLPNYYDSFSSLNKKQEFWQQGMPKGFLLEMTSWPKGKNSNEKYTMNVTEINKNKKSSISTDGYRIMEMPAQGR